eukprot:TRINITY_DN81110_c0_g1_i1.p1 TRINITY_DN81110_c0_g1~~TRINITY_DN81110_c0_g1_i1.p1  ORF type:complete len:180 (+),score=27.64 TRINITY_DN81110_c0_g1_i1:535-1074(+)
MKKSTLTKVFYAVLVLSLSVSACKKGSTTTDDERREEETKERERKQAVLDKLSGKTYSLVVIKNNTTGENLMASTMFPACIADDTFTLSGGINLDFNYSNALCESTSKVYKGTYSYKSKESDSIRFAGMDEAAAYKLKGITKQEVFGIKTFDETNKTLVLSYKLANGNEVIRQYSFTTN